MSFYAVCVCLCALPQTVLAEQRVAQLSPACLAWCVWFLCCGGGITQGISRILAAPIDGTEMTVSHHVVSRFNPSLFPGLKVAQTADYMSTTAGEQVTHHTAEIRLNKLFLGCLGVFNPNMESCLSWPSLNWIRRLQTAFLCSRVWRKQLLVCYLNKGVS